MARHKSLIYGFWDRLDQACYDSNISKLELSKRIGCDRKTLYEGSGATPNPMYLARICVQLNVSADYLLGISEEVRPV